MSAWAVIFDFDGVIIDSETWEFLAHQETLAEHGVTLTADLWREQVGSPGDSVVWATTLCEGAGRRVEAESFRAAKSRRFRTHVRYEATAGIADLLDDLDRAGAPFGIASNSPATWVKRATRCMGLNDRFRAIVTREAAVNLKPAPDVYLEAARRLGVPAERCVAIEDSPHGVDAAAAAGMRVVAIPTWLTDGASFANASLRVASATELDASRLRGLALDGR